MNLNIHDTYYEEEEEDDDEEKKAKIPERVEKIKVHIIGRAFTTVVVEVDAAMSIFSARC